MAIPRRPQTVLAVSRGKTSFNITPEAKYRLSTLKASLRLAGVRATESLVIEALLSDADEKVLLSRFKRGME